MTGLPYQAGLFVWCRFPFEERPRDPGPKELVGYVLTAGRIRGNTWLTVITLYTTTSP